MPSLRYTLVFWLIAVFASTAEAGNECYMVERRRIEIWIDGETRAAMRIESWYTVGKRCRIQAGTWDFECEFNNDNERDPRVYPKLTHRLVSVFPCDTDFKEKDFSFFKEAPYAGSDFDNFTAEGFAAFQYDSLPFLLVDLKLRIETIAPGKALRQFKSKAHTEH